MARFAKTIIKRMSLLTHNLSANLGSDTLALTLRIGLHSGPVTAGVLRGERSRFQLFGDVSTQAVQIFGRVETTAHTWLNLCFSLPSLLSDNEHCEPYGVKLKTKNDSNV
jgi:class 3 adenylate cyclase